MIPTSQKTRSAHAAAARVAKIISADDCPATDAIAEKAALHACFRERVTQLATRAAALRTKITDLSEAIPAAIATGNADAATLMRHERAEAEAEARDIDRAERIASGIAEQSDTALALVQLPDVRKRIADASASFDAAVDQLHRLAHSVLETAREGREIYSRSRLGQSGPTDANPSNAFVLSGASTAVLRLLGNISPEILQPR